METTLAGYAIFRYFEFKSYYVVWKRVSIALTQDKKTGLNRTM